MPVGKVCCWFNESDSGAFFLFIKTRFFFNVPLGSTVAFTPSICLWYILGNFGHARSQGERQPASTNPPLCIYRLHPGRAGASARRAMNPLAAKRTGLVACNGFAWNHSYVTLPVLVLIVALGCGASCWRLSVVLLLVAFCCDESCL